MCRGSTAIDAGADAGASSSLTAEAEKTRPRWGGSLGGHVAPRTEAAVAERLDQPLLGAVVADRLAGGPDPARESRLGDDPPTPDLLVDLLLRDRAVRVRDEQLEEREDLRLELHPLAVSAELQLIVVELERLEAEDHRNSSKTTGLDAPVYGAKYASRKPFLLFRQSPAGLQVGGAGRGDSPPIQRVHGST